MNIRPWQPGDLQRLIASQSLYSGETCTWRFLTGQQRLPAHYLAGIRHHEAAGGSWTAEVATDRDRVVAVAECAWEPGGTDPPELAIMVADAWQRRGLGRRTLGGLVRRCAEAGLTTFRAEYLHSNPAVRPLAAAVAGRDWSVRVLPGTGTHRMIISAGRLASSSEVSATVAG